MTETKNPFLEPYNTPHHTPPFHLIKVEHYEPAIREGMKEQNEEIDAIVNNAEKPNFQNTIVALERSCSRGWISGWQNFSLPKRNVPAPTRYV